MAAAGTANLGGRTPKPRFPLRLSANRRYLEDQDGVPFPILGDAGWEAGHNLGPSDQQLYLSDRTGRGFNSILVEAIDHNTTCAKPPRDLSSALPFTTRLDGTPYLGSPNGTKAASGSTSQFPADPYTNIAAEAPAFTYPNSPYWAWLDAFVSLCAANGVEVFLFPAYAGMDPDVGWLSEMVANDAVIGAGGFGAQTWSSNTRSSLWNYGAWLAQHYASYANIIWVLGGDSGTGKSGFYTTAQTKATKTLLEGMKSVPRQLSPLRTAHWGRNSLASDLPDFASDMDLESVYVNRSVGREMRRGYAHTPVAPTFEIEDYYDGDSAVGFGPDRQFQWWSFLDGLAGQFYGHVTLWRFATGWQKQLGSQGAMDMAVLNGFVRSIPWQNLIPSGLSGQKTIVVSTGGTLDGPDYIACAADSGVTAACYVPPAWSWSSFTIDASVMSAPFRARWLSPATGAYSTIATNIANTGDYRLVPPRKNESGFADWTLVLDVAGASSRAPATHATNIGQSGILADDDEGNGDRMIGQSVTLAHGATLRSLSFYVVSPSGSLRLGVYDAAGPSGEPGTKVVEAPEIKDTVRGWNSVSMDPPVALTAGTYWLAYLSSSNALHSRRTGASSVRSLFYPLPYGALPATFWTAASSDSVERSFFATLDTTWTNGSEVDANEFAYTPADP